jgi:hypothetical protein
VAADLFVKADNILYFALLIMCGLVIRKSGFKFLLLLGLLFSIQKGWGQVSNGDSILRKASADYLLLMKQNASLYNGAEYIAPKQLIEGFPFFGRENYFDGRVITSGVSFFDVPIQYDLVNDVLLIWSYDRSILLMLNSEKIERFQLGNESFIRGSLIKKNDAQTRKGFFQLIHEGQHMAISKKQKVVVQKTASDKSYAFYKQFNTYYLIIDGDWIQIASQKSVISALKSSKDAIKTFVSKQKLNFRKSPEVFLKEVLTYYETLNK